jgi:hypothetical protein
MTLAKSSFETVLFFVASSCDTVPYLGQASVASSRESLHISIELMIDLAPVLQIRIRDPVPF